MISIRPGHALELLREMPEASVQLTPAERAARYSMRWPERPPLQVCGDVIYGVWMIGNVYTRDPYYGAYPHGLLDRILTVFPERPRLHLFSGSIKDADGLTCDINPSCHPDFCGDARDLSSLVDGRTFHMVIADPPYNAKACGIYGTKPIDRRRVVQECAKATLAGGYLVWLDTMIPIWSKRDWTWGGLISVTTSTNRAFRGITILRRNGMARERIAKDVTEEMFQ